ncbi:hypothetical protein ABEH87_04165 [Erwinia sp. Eh17-17]|uniref:hypothetical protein n=1 Tax=Erwinia sp. Eh17-17 TaxID=3080330 RepID=UPI0032084D41
MMLNKWNFSLLVLSAFLITSVVAADEVPRPLIGNKMDAYIGPRGIEVRTLRLGELTEHQALVQVSNVDNDWDGRIQKMAVQKTSKDERYSTMVDGKPYVVLILNQDHGELYLPGENKEMFISYSDGLANDTPPQHFLTKYLEQSDKQ